MFVYMDVCACTRYYKSKVDYCCLLCNTFFHSEKKSRNTGTPCEIQLWVPVLWAMSPPRTIPICDLQKRIPTRILSIEGGKNIYIYIYLTMNNDTRTKYNIKFKI